MLSTNTPRAADIDSMSPHDGVLFAFSPVCPDAQIFDMSDSNGGTEANSGMPSGLQNTWRELEKAAQMSTNTEHVRRALVQNQHLLHGLPISLSPPLLPSVLLSFNAPCPTHTLSCTLHCFVAEFRSDLCFQT